MRGYGGFYTVKVTSGAYYQCRLRGKHRWRGEDVLVGDRVRITPIGRQEGVVEEILPRRNCLARPPVANVDYVTIVIAFVQPAPNWKLCDRMLLNVEYAGLKAIVCLNKVDLVEAAAFTPFIETYQQLYPAVITSARTGRGMAELAALLAGKVVVLAGASGVGKSSLLNALAPGLALKTGEVSAKIGRGRHTTRYVELLELANETMVVDTPGFTRLFLPEIEAAELDGYFPELTEAASRCRFHSCLHYQEPGCAVRDAVATGKIAAFRYEHYLAFLQELQERERSY